MSGSLAQAPVVGPWSTIGTVTLFALVGPAIGGLIVIGGWMLVGFYNGHPLDTPGSRLVLSFAVPASYAAGLGPSVLAGIAVGLMRRRRGVGIVSAGLIGFAVACLVLGIYALDSAPGAVFRMAPREQYFFGLIFAACVVASVVCARITDSRTPGFSR